MNQNKLRLWISQLQTRLDFLINDNSQSIMSTYDERVSLSTQIAELELELDNYETL